MLTAVGSASGSPVQCSVRSISSRVSPLAPAATSASDVETHKGEKTTLPGCLRSCAKRSNANAVADWLQAAAAKGAAVQRGSSARQPAMPAESGNVARNCRRVIGFSPGNQCGLIACQPTEIKKT